MPVVKYLSSYCPGNGLRWLAFAGRAAFILKVFGLIMAVFSLMKRLNFSHKPEVSLEYLRQTLF